MAENAFLQQKAKEPHGLGRVFRHPVDMAFTSSAPTPKAGSQPSPMAADTKHSLSLGRAEERSGTAAGSNTIQTTLGAQGRL